MYRNARRLMLALSLAVCALISAVPLVLGAPSIAHGYVEFEARIDDCGIGTIQLSIDAVSITNETGNHVSFNVLNTGTAIDTITGDRYRLVDHSTQVLVITQAAVTAQVAERAFLLVGTSGGLLSRGLVLLTIGPDGSISDFELQFVKCHPR